MSSFAVLQLNILVKQLAGIVLSTKTNMNKKTHALNVIRFTSIVQVISTVGERPKNLADNRCLPNH